MHKDSEYGRLSVHDDILSQLTSVAVAHVAGVVSLVPRTTSHEGTSDGHGAKEYGSHGVSIGVDALGSVVIDISIAVRYGVKIKDVGLDVIRAVQRAIWDAVATRPNRIVIHVEGVRK